MEKNYQEWYLANQHYLMTFVDYAHYLIRTAYNDCTEKRTTDKTYELKEKLKNAKTNVPGTTSIAYLAKLYGLTEFEQNILLLAIAPNIDPNFLYIRSTEKPLVITLGLALAVFENADWSALKASASLRSNGLIELDTNHHLTLAPIIVPEPILHSIIGVRDTDMHINNITQTITNTSIALDSKNNGLLEYITSLWQTDNYLFTLTGKYQNIKHNIAAHFANLLNIPLKILPSHFIPSTPKELQHFIIRWNREMMLNNVLLLVDCSEEIENTSKDDYHINLFLSKLTHPILCASQHKRIQCYKKQYAVEVSMPSMKEQLAYFSEQLPAPLLTQEIQEICSHFNLSFHTIEEICKTYPTLKNKQSLWEICRTICRQNISHLAEKIEPSESSQNIALPPIQHAALESMIAHVKLKAKLHEEWDMPCGNGRGNGIVALFHGASGTGKTTASEYLAARLKLDLYRIDLSSVVSKYVGETEKNLQQIFDKSEESGAILLFDEADSLFSKRTNVEDSHNKHSNSQVSFLLQRIESFRGIAILTSNLRDSFDKAFIRRLRFIVPFTFPNNAEREMMWRKMIPAKIPTSNIDYTKLAKLSMAGGNIRNISQHACFSAAQNGEILEMKHFLEASKREYAKMEQTISINEVKDWI